MNNREYAKSLIDQIPESKMLYVIAFLFGASLPEGTLTHETKVSNDLDSGSSL
ncbi:MAG: hypothetical protein LUC90_04185 [Lachnospiraceae bacterium]|nr:hypothetical protein [Lachnospiraceae bacterium]